jgi:hypothetical protein
VRRLFPVAAVAVVLLASCGGTDRPEGVVERWLVSLNQGKAGEPDTYAPEHLSQRILPHWETRDPGDLDTIEVGKGRAAQGLAPPGVAAPTFIEVPLRVERTTGVKIDGLAVVHRNADGDWRVQSLTLGRSGLRVPSEGGAAIGGASAVAWLAALGISALLMLLVGFVMRLTPKPAVLPTTKQ